MLKLFKSTFTMYLVMTIVGGVALLFMSNTILPTLMWIIWIIWIFIAAFICNYIAIKKVNKITALMTEKCQIKDYIICYNNLLKKNISKRTQTFLLLNLSSGYLNLGDSYSAKQVLDTLNNFPDTRVGALNKIFYHNNLIAYYLQVKDIEGAAQQIENFRIALDNPKINKKYRELYFHFYNEKKFTLNIEKGIYDGTEDIFNRTFQREKHKLDKVFAKYVLGKIYLHFNESDKALEAFTFAQNNGGDSYYAENARHYLENINTIK